MEDVNPSELNEKIQDDINKVIRYLQQIANLRYHLLIYRLVKKGHVSIKDVAEDSGYAPRTIYQIVDTMESKQESLQ